MKTVSLSICQCRCVACGNSWITSSAALLLTNGTRRGAALVATDEETHPVPISRVWDHEITHLRCYRCITLEELSATKTAATPPLSDDQLLEVPPC